MLWIKLGIIITGFLYASLLPYTLSHSLKHIDIDLTRYTLSFLSNRDLYGVKYQKAYTRLLFSVSLLQYAFFWLLLKFYNLGDHGTLIKYTDYSFAFLTVLAFVPHNLKPYRAGLLRPNILRTLHNVFAVLVFLMLPYLIVSFQLAIMPRALFLGIAGLVIIGLVASTTLFSIIKNGLNGISELFLINGISIWSIFVTIITLIE